MNEIKVLNTKLATLNASEMRSLVKGYLLGGSKKQIGKVNTEFLLRVLKEDEFCAVLNSCDVNIADGKGVLWAAKYLSLPLTKIPVLRQIQVIWQMKYTGASLVFYPKYCQNPIPENIPGLDAMYLMLEAADEAKVPVYFFGAEKEVLPKAIDKIKAKYPALKVAGFHDGYSYKDREIIREINESGAKLLIVALGSPKQEYWIRDNIDKLDSVRVAVGEGGSLDRVADPSRKAPKFMQKVSLEWLWRLFMNKNKSVNTGGRAKRVWKAVPVFIYNVVKFKLENS
ncbi:MAG: WecB/TagA/CpsF family glycosyltransferase [bacterium]|nr:WecB/TagA/CpsF family glycosyltransferase [bacterium]